MRAIDLPPSQRTILITGCSSGIGKHCALALAEKGYRVFATARKPEDVGQLQQLGLTAFVMDMQDSQSIDSALQQVLAQTGGQLFAVFNNAGYGQPGAVEDLTRELLREQFETNLFGVLDLTNRVIPYMHKQGYGRIVQNSSLLGLVNLPFRGAYNSTKHALESLTATMRLELQGTGIEVCCIEPGPIKSRFRANAYQRFLQTIPVEKSALEKIYRLLTKRLANETKEAPFTLGPEAVEKALLKALNDKHAKQHYYVTVPTYFLSFLKRWLPASWLEKVLLRAAGTEGAHLRNRGNSKQP